MKRILIALLFAASLQAQTYRADPWRYVRSAFQMLMGTVGGAGAVAPSSSPVWMGGSATFCNDTADTCSVTYSPTSGNLLVVNAYSTDAAAASVADNATGGSTTYDLTYSIAAIAPIAEFHTCNAKAGITTITVTYNSGPGRKTVHVSEYSHSVTSNCADSHSASINRNFTATTHTAASSSPTAGQAEVIHGLFVNFSDGSTTFGSSSPYVIRSNAADWINGRVTGVTSQIVASTSGTYAAAASTSVAVHVDGATSTYK